MIFFRSRNDGSLWLIQQGAGCPGFSCGHLETVICRSAPCGMGTCRGVEMEHNGAPAVTYWAEVATEGPLVIRHGDRQPGLVRNQLLFTGERCCCNYSFNISSTMLSSFNALLNRSPLWSRRGLKKKKKSFSIMGLFLGTLNNSYKVEQEDCNPTPSHLSPKSFSLFLISFCC